MEELEPDGDSAQAVCICAADHEKVVGADAMPPIACLSGDARESEESDQNEGNGSFKFHNRSDGLLNSIRISEVATQSMTGFQD